MSFETLRRRIIGCERCPRLRSHCRAIAREKRAAFRHEEYWARPVPGFGDPNARLLVVGLAPAAHGGNRTGRMFTGDRSGDFLMAALCATGFANLPTSRDRGDGLVLTDAYISAAARCAPPANKPTPQELANCLPYLLEEFEQLRRVKVIVALGRVAFEACWRLMASRGLATPRPKPRFSHGALFRPAGGPAIIASFHPSQQNTFTGRLTPTMLKSVFRKARSTDW